MRSIDLGTLGLDAGGHILVKRALRVLAVGAELEIVGSSAVLGVHARAICRASGDQLVVTMSFSSWNARSSTC